MPSPTLEEYLETIFRLASEGDVRPKAIALAMGVSGPTVTATLGRLQAQGLVDRERTRVVLTEEGRAQALAVVRRHRVAERFLVDVLGLDWEAAHEEACRWEHAFSDRVLEALESHLDNPASCPHGHPIPGADGSIALAAGCPLSSAEAGVAVRVLRVGEDHVSLRYLEDLGLVPGVMVRVIEHSEATGMMSLLVDGRSQMIALPIAAHVIVECAAP